MKISRNNIFFALAIAAIVTLCYDIAQSNRSDDNDKQLSLADYKSLIKNNELMNRVDSMARGVVASGFSAGSVYNEVWIRDYNTFIELSMDVLPDEQIRQNLAPFFAFQGPTGEVVDGFVDIKKANLNAEVGYKYRLSDNAPMYAAHKNTVETDQESSLVQAVCKYVKKSGNRAYLQTEMYGRKVVDRLEDAINYLLSEKMAPQYGLITGATTVDWGDVQPEHEWGVEIDENTHFAIDIYDNAMFVLAISSFLEVCDDSQKVARWTKVRDELKQNVRKYLWDAKNQKFIPHIYLDGSPFPASFDESRIYYHGGTGVAVQAGLLSKEEIAVSNQKMLENVRKAHAQSIGLTVYPTYPHGYFKNTMLYPYGYQNGGDWTWFGARMIMGMIENGFIAEAYDELQPMLARVVENEGFYEWYTPAGEPMGSGTYRGEAGVLYKCNEMLRVWAANN